MNSDAPAGENTPARPTSAKLAITAAVSALAAFTLARFVVEPTAALPAAPTRGASPSSASALVSTENQRLKIALQNAADDLDRENATHAQLLAERDKPVRAPAREDGLIGVPLPRHEIQSSVLNNLRKVRAAQDQFHLEHGRAPTSIDELVGARAFIRRLVPVDGEDYTSLSMQPGGTLAVTTASGVTVKYGDGTGPDATTQVEFPPDMARWREMEAKVKPAAKAAIEAYRMAHRGKDPPHLAALTSFFATPQEAADFLEFLETRRASRGY